MAHVVSGKLRKPPFVKDGCGQDGQSRMYGIELAEVIKDYKSGEKSYTNYKALFFAKTQAAKDYYDQAMAEGRYVVVACEKLKIEQREHNGNTYISLQMENARLEGAMYDEQPQGQQQRQQPAGQQQNRQAQSQQGYTNPPADFYDDEPF